MNITGLVANGLQQKDVQQINDIIVVGGVLQSGKINATGYKGRLALYEIMSMDDALRELIMTQASTAVLKIEARKRGMRTLRESGMLSIYDGQTTIDEVVRETLGED